jgi:glycerophosphoryl diester phosphodiesterase
MKTDNTGPRQEKAAPRWISHRGLAGPHAENSYKAFCSARAAGFHEIETDLRTTVDGHIVLHHDPCIQRNLTIENIPLTEFLRCTYEDGQRGLSFEHFASEFDEMHWILDIKPESGSRTLARLHDWARQNRKYDHLIEQTRFLVWTRQHMKQMQQLFPHATTMATQGECLRAGLSVLAHMPSLGGIQPNRTYSLPSTFHGQPLYRENIIDAYHQRGARVLAFLPETKQEVDEAIGCKVDEILLNGTPGSGESIV